ncbi:phage tail protein [Pseudoduganella sp. OTU4001]|uniref:phage tail protein n=1 Tax=Pseudoduganella sp. OTU4001 TaxID=3043854 RepID=UPI00313EC9DB
MELEPFIGEIRIFGGNFPPHGWALCDGKLLSIAQNTALFSLLGTTYGGNGQTTFALPDLRGRVPAHPSQEYPLGAQFGTESVTLQSTEIPQHSHSVAASTAIPAPAPNGLSLTGATLYVPASPGKPKLYAPDGATADMSPLAVAQAPAGAGQPHNNMAPYLAMTYIIALEGVFPQRS